MPLCLLCLYPADTSACRELLGREVPFENNPICALLPREVKMFREYYDLLRSKAQYTSEKRKQVIDALVLALIYDMKLVSVG